jgi:CDP-glycerol glycerophosphotransferase
MVADALITDYSSIMFDFAITGRPIGFFAPDLALYRHLRGAYFDLRTDGPGPVLEDMDAVLAWLGDIDAVHASYAERYAGFRSYYASYDDGTAAEQLVQAVFGDWLTPAAPRRSWPAAPPAGRRSGAGA